jgi:hypothetical protein
MREGAEIMNITITESDARQFLSRPGNPHIVQHNKGVQIVSESYYRAYRGRLITTRADLAAIDPAAATYEPAMLAGLLSDYASNMED